MSRRTTDSIDAPGVSPRCLVKRPAGRWQAPPRFPPARTTDLGDIIGGRTAVSRHDWHTPTPGSAVDNRRRELKLCSVSPECADPQGPGPRAGVRSSADAPGRVLIDLDEMQERFAVAFREGTAEASGRLDVEPERLLLQGGSARGELTLEIPCSELREVRVAQSPNERLNGYRTLVLERSRGPAIQVAPLGVAFMPEIVSLLSSLTNRNGDELAVRVSLKEGCLGRARELLAKGPPLDPAKLGLSGHEVYLREGEAVFVFRGSDVQTRISRALAHPAVWRAGLAWQRCFATAPKIVDAAEVWLEPEPAYAWSAPRRAKSDQS